MTIINKIMLILKDEEGQGMVEYALILSFIALAVVGALTFFGESVKTNLYEKVTDNFAEIIDSF